MTEQDQAPGVTFGDARLLTAEDVAAVLGVTAGLVRVRGARRRERGQQIGQLVAGAWLFTPADVERLRPDERFRPKSMEGRKES